MSYRDLSPGEKRTFWWQAQRNTFGLPDALYAPLPFAVVVVAALGAGSAFIGLYPGVDTHAATLSGTGAPWIGLLVLALLAGVGYWSILQRGYARQGMGAITGAAAILAVLINRLALDVLVVQESDAFIGGLGLLPLLGGLLLLLGFLFDGFVLSVLMGAIMGLIIGGLAGFPIGFVPVLIMMLIYSPLGALAGGIAGILRPRLRRR